MTWRIRTRAVRDHGHGLRWTLYAACDDYTTIVVADSTFDGVLLDVQSDDYAGTTGDAALDFEVGEHIADFLALRSALQSLDEIDRRRGRVQVPADRSRWAA
ncbi:MAG TPA: hypothetical protein VK756_07640 [Solirubrobacteraceae bacterium]|jgi:hypothetical protein|nr:hypothetical protein [Solirubrobacteraceae bacterium]